MANVFIVEAETNGAGAGSLPAIGGLSPPMPPTLAYFQGQNAAFTKLQALPVGCGENALLTRPLTDVVLIFSEVAASVKNGHVPKAPTAVAAGIANGVYLSRSSFKAA